MRSKNILDTPIEYLKGVGPARADILKKELHIYTYYHLLHHFPFRYVDKSKFYKINEISSDEFFIQLKGKVVKSRLEGKPRSQRLIVTLDDNTGQIDLVWFKSVRWIANMIVPGEEYTVFGKPSNFKGRFNIPHPEIESSKDNTVNFGEKLQSFYPSTEKLKSRGLDSKGLSKIIKNMMLQIEGVIQESLPDEIFEKFRFIRREQSFVNIHFPKDQSLLEKAKIRLKFEELFFIQLNLIKLKLLRTEKSSGYKFLKVGKYFNDFYNLNLPFKLTGAQRKVIKEIRKDEGSGKQMNRLLQGDVGSGKTLVALMSMLIALDNNFQACLMAPTEILAKQHYASISKMLEGLGININLLTGSTKTSDRNIIHSQLKDGTLQILIGTHALIEDIVQFKNLGMVVIDEQHRFGVAQRARLWKKSIIPPHVLVMTATPIPRTLAMTLYGDLDISVIDELPPGRKSVKTAHYYDKDRLKLFGFLKKQIAAGRQVYIVYPLITESEKLDLKDLHDGYESITRAFPLPEFAISIVHGKMKPKEKDYEMQRFVKGETQIMVATTVIEVGVDVPNASLMVIENAERFGLSQLHQLRGRVGRGAEQSYCILMTKDKLTHEGRKRIQTMVRTTDGFEIAEADLKLRGPGDLQGTQQSGVLDLKIADIIKDESILKYSRNLAIKILKEDPYLELPKNAPIARQLMYINQNKPNWSLIS